jgi:hypothetical protein
MLSDSLHRDSRVDIIVGKVKEVSKNRNLWDFARQGIKQKELCFLRVHTRSLTSEGLTLEAKHYPPLTVLDLGTCLKPSVLGSVVPAGSKVVAIGSSHPAVLVLKNLYELCNASIVNFSRAPLLYGIYKGGWILYDDTGLKGMAADRAREVLDTNDLPPRLCS